MKKVTILLTEYSDALSRFIYYISGRGYTHISLGLEEDEDRFYSFNYKGFCIETIEKHRRRGVHRSVCYEIAVEDKIYEVIKSNIQAFEQNRDIYHYTKLGVFFAVLHLPFKRKNHYFCSRFVAEQLLLSGAMKLKKSASLYLPNQLTSELERFSGVMQVIPNVI